MPFLKTQILASILMLSSCAAAAPPAPTNPAGAAPAKPAEVPVAAAVADPSMDKVLDSLDARGQNLKGFTADVKLVETDNIGQENTRTGTVRFQQKAADDARIRVNFTQREDDKRIYPDEKIEYVLDNGWLTDRDYKKKIEIKRQILRPGEKVNLLKLGEGPFPLPIGQKKEEVHRLFDVKKIAPDPKEDPADSVHLKLTPKPGTQFAKKLSFIEVWVDSKTNFPSRIDTANAAGSDFKSTRFGNLKINPDPPLKDADFVLDKVPEGQWERREEPFSG